MFSQSLFHNNFLSLLFFSFFSHSNENKVRKPVATTHGDVHCCTDGPVRKGLMGQQPLFINPERLKDFGEDDEHNGEVETWEMKIISHNDELLLRDSNSMSLSTYSKSINFEDISAAAFKIQGGVQKTPCMVQFFNILLIMFLNRTIFTHGQGP